MAIYPFEGIFPEIHAQAFVHPDATIIGHVIIGPRTSIWPGVVIRGDVNRILIGMETNVQDGAILHVARPTEKNPRGTALIIGDRVTIGHQVTLHACHLENQTMIGIGAILLDGVVVGEEAMVGAGSLVPPGKIIPPRELWLGSPAKRIRSRSDEEIAATAATTANYVTLAQRHRPSVTD